MRKPEVYGSVRALPGRSRSLGRLVRERMHPRLWPIVQTAAAAVAAWYLAQLIVGSERPVFASIAAVISVGATVGQRRQRAVELIGGVVVGITVADLMVQVIGTGPLQIGLMIFLAMSAAVMLGGGALVVTEAGVSALLLAALEPAGPALPPTRFLEALIGGGVALVVSAVLFPPNPKLMVSRAARALIDELAGALLQMSDALARGDAGSADEALQKARGVDDRLDRLEDALATARESARLAISQRGARAELDAFAHTLTQLDYAVRNTRVLARHALRYVRRAGTAPAGLPEAVRELAAAVSKLHVPGDGRLSGRQVARLAREAAFHAYRASQQAPDSAVAEIVGQVRVTAADLIRAATQEGAAGSRAAHEEPTDELLVEAPAEDVPAGR